MNASDTPRAAVKPPVAAQSEKEGLTFKHGFILAFILFAVLNSMPFADAARFRKAIEACEKNLPRDQHCDVQGVMVQNGSTVTQP